MTAKDREEMPAKDGLDALTSGFTSPQVGDAKAGIAMRVHVLSLVLLSLSLRYEAGLRV